MWKFNENHQNSSTVNLKLGEVFEYAIQLWDSQDEIVDDPSVQISLEIPGLTPTQYSYSISIYDQFTKTYWVQLSI